MFFNRQYSILFHIKQCSSLSWSLGHHPQSICSIFPIHVSTYLKSFFSVDGFFPVPYKASSFSMAPLLQIQNLTTNMSEDLKAALRLKAALGPVVEIRKAQSTVLVPGQRDNFTFLSSCIRGRLCKSINLSNLPTGTRSHLLIRSNIRTKFHFKFWIVHFKSWMTETKN